MSQRKSGSSFFLLRQCILGSTQFFGPKIQPSTLLDILLTFHESLEEVCLEHFDFLNFPPSFPVFPNLESLTITGPYYFDEFGDVYVENPDCTERCLKGLKLMPNLRFIDFTYLTLDKERVIEAIRQNCPKVTDISIRNYNYSLSVFARPLFSLSRARIRGRHRLTDYSLM